MEEEEGGKERRGGEEGEGRGRGRGNYDAIMCSEDHRQQH